MSENMETSNEQNEKEIFTLWGVKLYKTQADENKYIAIKNKLNKKELENEYYDIVNANEDTEQETFSGIKFITATELNDIGIELPIKQGQKYNLFYENLINEEGKQEAKLLKADKVDNWTDIIKLKISDVRYTKTANKPFVVLYYSIKEENLEAAPNKEMFIEGMKDIGLESDLVPYNNWINFSAFIWIYENEIEKFKMLKNKNVHWILGYEQINDEPKKIKRIYGQAFEKDLLLEGQVKEISEDKKNVKIEKLTNWNLLKDEDSLSLLYLASEKDFLDKEEKLNIKLTFNINIEEETSVSVEDTVEIFLNEKNVKKIKNVMITLPELIIHNPFEKEPEEESNLNKLPEIDIDEDEIPF